MSALISATMFDVLILGALFMTAAGALGLGVLLVSDLRGNKLW